MAPGRALVVGWFSYEYADYTAGDLLAATEVGRWLREAGLDVDVARVHTLDGGVDLHAVDPHAYSHLVFVCGPFKPTFLEIELVHRFRHCVKLGVNLSLPVPLDQWQPFDRLYERDSSAAAHADLTFATPAPRVPVVGVCLVDPYEPARVDLVNAAIDRLLRARPAAVVRVDTRLDVNTAGLRNEHEVEALLAKMDVVLTSRLHGTVLALKHGVPVVALDVEPGGGKLTRQCEAIGWPAILHAGELDDEAVARAYDFCLSGDARRLAAECRARAVADVASVRERFLRDLATTTTVPPVAATAPPPRRLRVLHAIHDFLPRHTAGSEIYAFELCRALTPHAEVTVVCAEYDINRAHGDVTWRVHDGVAVAEIVNNWIGDSFEDTYRSPLITDRLAHVLDVVAPDVLHVHSLFNLSFDLPSLARQRGIPIASTLHDYTLVCASGGQRLHRAEAHRCHVIDAARCARCFPATPMHRQMSIGAAAPRPGLLTHGARVIRRAAPRLAEQLAGAVHRVAAPAVTEADMRRRLERAHAALAEMDLVVAPSYSIADEYRRLGADSGRLRVSDYGFTPSVRRPREHDGHLRVGVVGTPVWHKGVHVAIEAWRQLGGEPCSLDIHGDLSVDPNYAADLRVLAAGLPVRLHGAFDRTQVDDVYQSLDVLVVPSLWLENSPLVIHEAFMAGVPVIGSRIGGIPNLVRDGWNGWLFTPGSSTELAAIVGRLAREPERVREAARRAPPIKTMAEDAAAWDARYRALVAARTVVA